MQSSPLNLHAASLLTFFLILPQNHRCVTAAGFVEHTTAELNRNAYFKVVCIYVYESVAD